MPIYEVTDPETGVTLELEGDSPPTEQELIGIFAQVSAQQPQRSVADIGAEIEKAQQFGDFEKANQLKRDMAGAEQQQGSIIGGALEAGAAIGSGIVAEPLAGIAGLATSGANLLGLTDKTGGEAVEATRQALTFQPETQTGQESLQGVGETLAPVGEAFSAAEEGLGDAALDLTGSPALAAAAKTIPTALGEVLGFGLGRKVAKASTGLKAPKGKIKSPSKVSEKSITKSLVESAPEVEQIKDASRAIYKEIDELEVAVKPEAARSMLKTVIRKATTENADAVLTPKSARVVEQLTGELNNANPRTLSDLDNIRRKAQIAAQAVDPSDARVGAIMVDEIDDFMDKMGGQAFAGKDKAAASAVGERYKAARNLWGRGRRAEVITEMFDKAGRQASGFENGIRTQLRQLLNNKKRRRFFTKDELAVMDDVVKGSSEQNILKLVGRFGFSEGAATNVLGSVVSGGLISPIVPLAGQVSRKFAQKATVEAAKKVEALVRGGARGREITKAYMSTVPKSQRSSHALSEILLSTGADIDEFLDSSSKMAKEAAEIARGRKIFERLEGAGAVAPQTLQQEQQ